MKNQVLSALSTTLAALAIALPAAAQNGDGNLVIKAGKVITNAGETLENGTIVIQNGRITAVGKDIEYPWNAQVREFPDAVAFPGFVEAHTTRGMDRANENIDVAAFLNVRDSIDPVNFYYEDALRAGITTINVQQGADCVVGGMGYVVKPVGMTVEQMTVRPNSGLAMSASPKRGKSRATQAQALRRAFDDLHRYLDETVQEKKEGKDYATREAMFQGREPDEETAKGRPMTGSAWKVEGLELVPRWELDEKQAPLLSVVEGKTRVFLFCGSPMEVMTALSIASENGFLHRTVLVLDNSCWKAADAIAERGVPVVLDPNLMYVERDPLTGEEQRTFVPKVFQDKGIEFALRSAGNSGQSLWYQAAICMANGLTREQAIAATTTVPAKLLGLGDRVGSLEKGKDGNVVLFSGDPLSVRSFVQNVVIEGNLVYDRATDTRAMHLDSGAQPDNTAPYDPNGDWKPHCCDDPTHEHVVKTDEGEDPQEVEEAPAKKHNHPVDGDKDGDKDKDADKQGEDK
ncbi:MAG: amidohydrolase family protein [Planctomycetes bacterium]|nr:amidohydrolase family protein [Planctomycetota bacterium]